MTWNQYFLSNICNKSFHKDTMTIVLQRYIIKWYPSLGLHYIKVSVLNDFYYSVTNNWETTLAFFNFKNKTSSSLDKHKHLSLLILSFQISPIMCVTSDKMYNNIYIYIKTKDWCIVYLIFIPCKIVTVPIFNFMFI
jgi:hypothetical protein